MKYEDYIGHTFAVYELALVQDNQGCRVSVVASVPGREGAFTRTWKNTSGALSPAQLNDITAFVSRCVGDAIILKAGVQGVLFEPPL